MSDQPAETQDIEQVTSTTPTTKPAKNPKRMAVGKAVAEKTRQAREAQKKALAQANVIIANYKAKETPPPPEAAVPKETSAPSHVEEQNTTKNVLTTTQWLSVISILVSVIGLYYKREEIKGVFNPQTPPSQPLLEATSPDMHRPPPSQQPKKGIRPMD